MSKPTLPKPIFTTAQDVEVAFYDALERADLEAMMQVWSEDEEVVCVHPGGQRVVGLAAVRESWRQMFDAKTRLQVRVSQQVTAANMMLTVHSVLEQITPEGETNPPPPLVATNVYSRGAMGWHMVMHHASPCLDAERFEHSDVPRVVH